MIEDHPQPPLPAHAVRVEVHASSVAPSTLDTLAGHRGALSFPFIPGGASVGRVAEISSGVRTLHIGDWVYISPWIEIASPGHDPTIAIQGRGPVSPSGHLLSRSFLNGGYAAQLVAPITNVVGLPQLGKQSPAQWCALEHLHLAWSLLMEAGFTPGQHVVVLDPVGPIGTATSLLISALGAGHISIVGRSAGAGGRPEAETATLTDLKAALAGGASHSFLIGEVSPRLHHSADIVLDAQDRWIHHDVALSQLGFDLIRPGGTVIWSGGSKSVIDLPFQKLVRKSVRLLASERPRMADLGRLVAWLDSRRDVLNRYQAKSFSLSLYGEAFVSARSRLGLNMTTLNPN